MWAKPFLVLRAKDQGSSRYRGAAACRDGFILRVTADPSPRELVLAQPERHHRKSRLGTYTARTHTIDAPR